MDDRERSINQDIDDAERAKLNAQRLEEENRQKLKETQDEVHKILKMPSYKQDVNKKKSFMKQINVPMVCLKRHKVKLRVKRTCISRN